MAVIHNEDFAARRSCIDALTLLITCKGETGFMMSQKKRLIELFNETRSDKAKPVREATSEALSALRAIPDPS